MSAKETAIKDRRGANKIDNENRVFNLKDESLAFVTPICQGQFLGKPTSEANTAALKNTSTALEIGKAETSKSNVCIMTQDQCLDNGHHATSNIHSTNDQVSDDLNNAKNSVVSNGVNSVQEFNVDVNSKRSENRADVAMAIVQNLFVEIDADRPSSGKVFATSEQSAATSSDIVDSALNSNNFIIATDINKSECSNNNLIADMTVITHQNSSENIRDIIANSDQVNKDAIDSQITEIGNNVKSEQNSENENSVNKSGAVKKRSISSKREKNNKDESDKPEDPVARLNKLRASISSALSEVKGVLKQYSTEQSLDDENESTPSLQPTEDGPVRFRFVRKIRRRSAYSEDDTIRVPQKNENGQEVKSETPSTLINVEPKPNYDRFNTILPDDTKRDNDKTSSMIIQNEVIADKVSDNSKGENVPCQPENKQQISHPIQTQELTQVNKSQHLQQNESEVNLIEKKFTPQASEIQSHNATAPTEENLHVNNIVHPKVISQTPSKKAPEEITSTVVKQNLQEADPSVQTTVGNTTIKVKHVKHKKVVKKDRRASIAAVEANQVLPDKSLAQLELKTQRRPSDSGTLVKQPPLVKQKAKISEKPKLPTQHSVKAAAVSKTQVPAVLASNVAFSQQSQPALSSEKSVQTSQSKTNLPTAAHEQMSVIQSNEPPLPLQQDNTTSAIRVEVSTAKVLHNQTQAKIISPTAPHAKVLETKTNKTQPKVEVSSMTQAVAVNSQPTSSSEISNVNKATNTAGSSDKVTKINGLAAAKQNKEDHSMSTSENTTVPAPNQTEVHTATAVPEPFGDVPSDEVAKETELKNESKAEERMWFEEGDTPPSTCETPSEVTSVPPKKKRKAKRKVVIRRIKRKLSRDDTFLNTQEAPAELEIEEKEIEEKDDDEEQDESEIVPKQRKPCLKARQFEIGDVVMYAERYRKTQVKWKKAIVIERITSISYKLDIDGEEKPAHISYIKKFTDRKVNFGGKEYLEIDYAQIEEDEEKERNYSIWNLV